MAKRGRVVVTHPVSTSKRKIEVSIRLNVHTGIFTAELDGREYKSDQLLVLRDSITNAARQSDGDDAVSLFLDRGQNLTIIDINEGGDK